jgi:hypothetical protein
VRERNFVRAADDEPDFAPYRRAGHLKEAHMSQESSRRLDRVGAAAGIAFVLLFVGIIMVPPHLPAPQHSIADIAQTAAADRTGILVSVYLGFLLTGALLVFGAVVVARLWRSDEGASGWWIVALAGLTASAVPDDTVARFVRAVQHGATGDSLWIGYPISPDGVVMAIPLAVFLLGVGGARAGEVLPRWLSWLALVLAGALVVGAAGVAFDEFGGAVGPALFLGYVGLFVWAISVSVVLWREPRTYPVAQALAA